MDYSKEAHIQRLFDSYCKTVLRNEAKDIRKNRRKENEHRVELDSIYNQRMDNSFKNNIENEIIGSLVFGATTISFSLEKALSRLDAFSKSIIYLYYFENYNDREIGEILDFSVSGIWYRRTKAIEKLKEYLGG